MAGQWKFAPNQAGIKRTGFEPGVAALVGTMATRGAAAAKRIAPTGPTGQYQSSIVVGAPSVGKDGWEASFGSDDWGWHFVEFGSVNNAPYRVLTRAALSLGLKFEPR